MSRRNRALVKSIWFSLQLEEYDCPMCEGRAGDDGRFRHGTDDYTIIKAMHDLFWNLSTWELSQAQKKLALDISIYSPSDSQHHFKYLTFGPDAPLPDRKSTFSPSPSNQSDDPKHGWIAGELSSAPPQQALEYVHQEILAENSCIFWNKEYENKWWQSLPEAPIVSSILFRLQNRRGSRQRYLSIKAIVCFWNRLTLHPTTTA